MDKVTLDIAKTEAAKAGLVLEESRDGLVLSDGQMAIKGDFSRMVPRVKSARLKQELLVKAAKVKGVDIPTAGLGEDSLLLAAVGFAVTLYERNPVIAVLLGDALERASKNPALSDAVARMNVVQGDSVDALSRLAVSIVGETAGDRASRHAPSIADEAENLVARPFRPPAFNEHQVGKPYQVG